MLDLSLAGQKWQRAQTKQLCSHAACGIVIAVVDALGVKTGPHAGAYLRPVKKKCAVN